VIEDGFAEQFQEYLNSLFELEMRYRKRLIFYDSSGSHERADHTHLY
jgi:hypothetical protein